MTVKVENPGSNTEGRFAHLSRTQKVPYCFFFWGGGGGGGGGEGEGGQCFFSAVQAVQAGSCGTTCTGGGGGCGTPAHKKTFQFFWKICSFGIHRVTKKVVIGLVKPVG